MWKAVLLSFDYKAKNPPYGDTSYDAMLRYLEYSRLYLYGLEHGHLLFTNKGGARVRVPVNFAPMQA